MKKIVIIFGSPLITTVSLAKSLYNQGYSIVEILEPCDKKLCSLQYSKYVDKVFFLKRLEDGIDVIMKYKNEKYKPSILCSSDSSILLLDRNYNLLKDHFHFFNAGGEGVIGRYLDKFNTFSIAEDSGLSLIKTWKVADISKLPDNLVFPCLIKGNNSTKSTKGDMFICQNETELKDCLHEGVEYLVQEYIQKEYELDFVGFSYNHGADVYIPAVVRKIRDDLHRQSVYIRLDDIKDYADFDPNIIRRFLAQIGYEGIFSIEVIYSHGKFYFLEINLRNDGCQCIYTAAGINYPLLWVKYGENSLTDATLSAIRYTLPIYQMRSEDFANLLEGKVAFMRWIKELWGTGRFFMVDFRDPMPVIVGLLIAFRQMFKKIFRYLKRRIHV